MITIGQVLFAFPLAGSLCQAIKNFAPHYKINASQQKLSSVNFYLMLTCYLFLTFKFVISDFTYAVIYQNSHTAKPLFYKITGVWGNHEGSMLLFLLIISAYNYIYAKYSRFEFKENVLGYNGSVIFLITAYTYFTSNPFDIIDERFIGIQEGLGLNPLLQDVGLAIHPPMLYIGYAGFSIAFATALTVLRHRITDKKWVDYIRPWVLFSWGILSIGVGLGAWWAYRELGWGGFWFWDPVENISLLPWLFGTALIHSILCTKKFNKFAFLTIALSLCTFLCGLLGFFLVRSGVLTSVHTFAADPERGIFMLAITMIIASYAMIIFGKKLFEIKFYPEGRTFFLSREIGILILVIFLSAMALTIFLGIFYPMITELFFRERISVGEPYFNAVFVPITLVLMMIMVFAPILKWQQETMPNLVKRSFPSLIIALAVSAMLKLFLHNNLNWFYLTAVFSSSWLTASTIQIISLRYFRKEKISKGFTAMMISHGAFGLLALSITLNAALSEDKQVIMRVNDNVEMDGREIKLKSAAFDKSKNYLSLQGNFSLTDKHDQEYELKPQNRIYFPGFIKTHEADIHYTLLKDYYIVMGQAEPDESGQQLYPVRIYIKPFMFFIWFSVLAMAFGGFLAMLPKKK